MKVNVAVCGRFHYHNYVGFLARRGILNRFYYSHRLTTNAARLGIEEQQAVNAWPKEYLIRAHGRLLRGRLMEETAPLYARLWQAGILRRWSRADTLHLMLHGNGLLLARRAREDGSLVVVEPVNRHIEDTFEIVEAERERLGLKRRKRLRRVHLAQNEEAALSDFLLAPSRIVRDSFVKRGYDVSRTAVLPFGVNLDRFKPLDGCHKDELKFRVICVAQVSTRKGQIYLLEAWRKLALPDAELLLIGPMAHDMGKTMRRFAGSFKYIPGVSHNRLREFYAQSDVFVLPSLEDGCAVVCGEAMACGLPVITTFDNGASESIEGGRDGFVIPSRSSEAIAECLERLYRDRELLQEMSQTALAKAKTQLGWDTYAARLVEIYKTALTAGRKPEAEAV
jgi:glycosyltransferase involved in cell wall biosynthesis